MRLYDWSLVEVKGITMKKENKKVTKENKPSKIKLELEILELESRIAPIVPKQEGAEC